MLLFYKPQISLKQRGDSSKTTVLIVIIRPGLSVAMPSHYKISPFTRYTVHVLSVCIVDMFHTVLIQQDL